MRSAAYFSNAKCISGELTALGWAIIVVYLFFAVGSGYVLLTRSSLSPFHLSE
jgi:hypothetical protein